MKDAVAIDTEGAIGLESVTAVGVGRVGMEAALGLGVRAPTSWGLEVLVEEDLG